MKRFLAAGTRSSGSSGSSRRDATLITDREGRRTFETDALTAYRCMPLAVVLPASTEEVSAILRYCHDNKVKVVPRGAGTSLCRRRAAARRRHRARHLAA